MGPWLLTVRVGPGAHVLSPDHFGALERTAPCPGGSWLVKSMSSRDGIPFAGIASRCSRSAPSGVGPTDSTGYARVIDTSKIACELLNSPGGQHVPEHQARGDEFAQPL